MHDERKTEQKKGSTTSKQGNDKVLTNKFEQRYREGTTLKSIRLNCESTLALYNHTIMTLHCWKLHKKDEGNVGEVVTFSGIAELRLDEQEVGAKFFQTKHIFTRTKE